MDGQRSDRIARSLATRMGRRQALLAALGLGGAGLGAIVRAAGGVGAAQSVCKGMGEPCTLWVRCCEGLACVGAPMNPNAGVCTAGVTPRSAGGNGGTGGGGNGGGGQAPTLTPGSGQGSTATATATAGSGATTTPTATSTATTTPTATATPTGDVRRRQVRVDVVCQRTPDRVRVENKGGAPITIETIVAEYRANSGGADGRRVFYIEEDLGPGRVAVFEFGPGSGRDGTNRELFAEGQEGVVEVETTAGTVRELCREPDEARAATSADA